MTSSSHRISSDRSDRVSEVGSFNSRLPRASYETGESSAAGSHLNSHQSNDSGSRHHADDHSNGNGQHDAGSNNLPNGVTKSSPETRDGRKHRKTSAGGFLLNIGSAANGRSTPSRIPKSSTRAGSTRNSQTPESTSSKAISRPRQKSTAPLTNSSPSGSKLLPRGSTIRQHDDVHEGTSAGRQTNKESSAHDSGKQVDLDSAQIVQMALSLSESRRIVSGRRNLSGSMQPRMSMIPQSSTSANLKQALQDSRRISHSGSPIPTSGFQQRLSSVGMPVTHMQPSLESSFDGQFRYQFSAATIARAQKAKEHLELKAEYYRLLEVLPPLRSLDRATTASPPSSPTGHLRTGWLFGSPQSSLTKGRQYNPLQYIRNRKVRARERKTIDGERMGFDDLECVRAWIDKTAHRGNSSATINSDADSLLPIYPAAEAFGQAEEPQSKSSVRTRRPRVDWIVEPCDMIADAYWIEQDSHKYLIEDRNWQRLLVPPPELSRPYSQQSRPRGGTSNGVSPFTSRNQAEADVTALESQLDQSKVPSTPTTTMERARSKLQGARSFHHRHTSSIGGDHSYPSRRGSESEFSDSDREGFKSSRTGTRRPRNGTISGDTSDLLQMQMVNAAAQEARERELASLPETEKEHSPNLQEPNLGAAGASSTSISSPLRNGKDSLIDVSDLDYKSGAGERVSSTAAHIRGKASLDLPTMSSRRGSLARDWSVPTSPELRPKLNTDSSLPNGDLFVQSRSPSPSRNPMSRVKQKWRDRDLDQAASKYESHDREPSNIDEATSPGHHSFRPHRYGASIDLKPSGDRAKYSSHRSTHSAQLQDEQLARYRSARKKPRPDTGLRARLGDVFGKKYMSGDSSDPDATDDSENEVRRGRSRGSISLSRPFSKSGDAPEPMGKTFLEAMPDFHRLSDTNRSAQRTEGQPPSGHVSSNSRPGSRQSSRFQLLKPPRIDVRSASPSASPPAPAQRATLKESDLSDATSQRSRLSKTAAAAASKSSLNVSEVQLGRHWSINHKSDLAIDQPALTRRDIARMRALILSSGVKAMEITRRASAKQRPLAQRGDNTTPDLAQLPWRDIVGFLPASQLDALREQNIPHCDLYTVATSHLQMAIQQSGQRWQESADRFGSRTAVGLQKRIWNIRSRITEDLSVMTRSAADEADETARELALGQPLKLKKVYDLIENMSRNRRRRFRWVRRGLWLMVEWILVSIMWYVWFVVMILRIFLGVGKGLVGGVRWLLWL